MLPQLSTTDLAFTLTTSGGPLGLEFLGPTLRGLFGYGLRAVACPHASDQNGRCCAPDCCDYAHLFEGIPPPSLGTHRNEYTAVPQPFVLLVDPPRSVASAPNAPPVIKFVLRLFGDRAIALTPSVIRAVESRTKVGIGPQRAAFRVSHVEQAAPQSIPVGAPLLLSQHAPDSVARLDFLTPLSLRHGGKAITNPTAADLVESGRRRLWLLARCYGDAAATHIPMPAPGAKAVFRTREAEWKPWRIVRHSGRQHCAVGLGGVLGHIVIAGPWQHEQWWLQTCHIVGVGRCGTFGFGRVDVKCSADNASATHCRADVAEAQTVTNFDANDHRGRKRLPRWINLRGLPPLRPSV